LGNYNEDKIFKLDTHWFVKCKQKRNDNRWSVKYNMWTLFFYAKCSNKIDFDHTSVQPISITKTLLIVPTKNERDPPLFTGKLLIKFQNILRNTTQVIIRHRIKILFSVISSPISLERQKWKSSKMKGILLSSLVSCW
jgi:two-component sensor histidine kinase